MQVILVRHGVAEDLELGSFTSDAERQLTKKGRKQIRQVAKGLRRITGCVDCVASSPFARAVQTAEALVEEFAKEQPTPFEIVEIMQCGMSADAATDWLANQDPQGKIVLVGHQPDLSILMAHLTTSTGAVYGKFPPAGACLIDFAHTPGAGSGKLVWLATPTMLGRLSADTATPA